MDFFLCFILIPLTVPRGNVQRNNSYVVELPNSRVCQVLFFSSPSYKDCYIFPMNSVLFMSESISSMQSTEYSFFFLTSLTVFSSSFNFSDHSRVLLQPPPFWIPFYVLLLFVFFDILSTCFILFEDVALTAIRYPWCLWPTTKSNLT